MLEDSRGHRGVPPLPLSFVLSLQSEMRQEANLFRGDKASLVLREMSASEQPGILWLSLLWALYFLLPF